MMSIEPRNEQLMLRQFRKAYPSYNLNALMRKRYEELMDARAFFLPFHTHCTRVQLANVRAGVARPLYWWQSNCQEITMSAQKPSEANGTTKPEPKAPKTQPNNKHTHTHQPNTDKQQRNGQEPTNETTEETQHNQQTKEHGRRTSNNSARTTTTKDEEQHARNQQTKPENQNQTHKECHISELATMAISTNYDIASLLVAAGDPRYRRERQHT